MEGPSGFHRGGVSRGSVLIFVTVGMSEYPFNRLLEEMDRIAPQLGEEVVMQTGSSGFKGINTECIQYMDDECIGRMYDSASLLICHAGVGSIINGMRRGIPVVAVPRRADLGEVDTDHQFMIASELVESGRGVSVGDIFELGKKIEVARGLDIGPFVKDRRLVTFLSDLLSDLEGGTR